MPKMLKKRMKPPRSKQSGTRLETVSPSPRKTRFSDGIVTTRNDVVKSRKMAKDDNGGTKSPMMVMIDRAASTAARS